MDDSLYKILRPILTGWFKLFFKPTITGKENIPTSGRIVLAGTHTSILDPVFILACNKRVIHFLAKDELVNGPLGFAFKKMGIIPVNRREKDVTVMPSSIKVLNNDEVVGIFPEGTINKTDDITMKFKTGATRMAYETNSEIVPFAITGKYKIFRKSVKIIYGKPYKVHSNDFRKETDILRSKVNKLIIGGEWYGCN